MDQIRVLVLNQTFEPINVCNARRAIRMMVLGKAETLARDGVPVRSEYMEFHVPVVIRLLRYVKVRRYGRVPFSKKNIYRRDAFTCQYCGQAGDQLTIDHIVPRSRGGKTTWENVVCCCRPCNSRKGDHLLDEIGMGLVYSPRKPQFSCPEWMGPHLLGNMHNGWKKFLYPIRT